MRKRYSPACTRLLSQYKTMLKLVGEDVPSIEEFMRRYRVRTSHPHPSIFPSFTSFPTGLHHHVKKNGFWAHYTIIDGPPRCLTQITSRRARHCRAFERSGTRDWKVGRWDYAGSSHALLALLHSGCVPPPFSLFLFAHPSRSVYDTTLYRLNSTVFPSTIIIASGSLHPLHRIHIIDPNPNRVL